VKKTILAIALFASMSAYADNEWNSSPQNSTSYSNSISSSGAQSDSRAVSASGANSQATGGQSTNTINSNPTSISTGGNSNATGGVSGANSNSNSISAGGTGGAGGAANSNASGGVGYGGVATGVGGTATGGNSSANPTSNAAGGSSSANPTANGGNASANPTVNTTGGSSTGGSASANPTANGTVNVGCLTNCGANATDKEIAAGHDAAIITAAGVTQTIKNTPALFAPALTSSNDTCMGSTSGGVSTPGFGVSIGSSWVDTNCKMLKNSRELWNMGFKAAAMAVMCTDAANKEALELTGFECPQTTRDKQATK